MRMGQRFPEEPEAIQMAPLIDIVFLTLVVFMVISAYATLESEVDITLPTADSAMLSERSQGEIFINLRADGVIVVNDREMDLDELQEVLNRVAEYFPGGAVIIRGDHQALLGRTIDILDCCRKADIQNIAFAVMKRDEESPGYPATTSQE